MVRKAAALPVLGVVAVATSGWFYLLNPALPGPAWLCGLALPLDELSHHASASLLWFAVVWGAAGAACSVSYARSAEDRANLPAALLFAVGTGTYAYLQTGVSVAVVRQTSGSRCVFDVAARTF